MDDTDVFSKSVTARDKEILILEKLQLEYNEKVLADSKNYYNYFDDIFKIGPSGDTAQKLQKLDDQVLKLQEQINENSKKVNSTDYGARIEVIKGIQNKLGRFSELRTAINSLNADFSKLNVSYRSHAMKLKNMKSLKDVSQLNDFEVNDEFPEEEIMKQFTSEVSIEINRFIKFLNGVFDTFVTIEKDSEDLNKTILIISSEDSSLISDSLSALSLLNALSPKFTELTSLIWTDFCDVILSSVSPDLQVVIERTKEGSTVFSSEARPKKGEKQNPPRLVQALEHYFEELHHVFKKVKVDESPLTSLIGNGIGERLVETLVLRCCAATVSIKRSDEEKMKKLKELIRGFDNKMRELHFFSDKNVSAEAVLTRSNRLFINQRCRVFMAEARKLVAKPYVDLVEVSSEPSTTTAQLNKIASKLENVKITSEEIISDKLTTPRFFEFKKCKISDSVSKLVVLIKELFNMSIKTEDQVEAGHFFEAALFVVDTFLVSTPKVHQPALLAIPQSAAIFYNNCHYIFHNLMCIKIDFESKLHSQSNMKQEDLDFSKQLNSLRETAIKFLNQQINSIKRNLSMALGDDDLFINIDASEDNRSRVDRAVNGCLMELEKLRTVWSEVMSESVLCVSMGVLVSHLLSLFTKVVLSKVDITVQDSESLARINQEVLQKVRKIMTINGEEGIHSVCRSQYGRLDEITFVLNANLVEISNRWCNGMGTLAAFLKPFEARGLICALFQNTPKRSEVLDEIKDRRM